MFGLLAYPAMGIYKSIGSALSPTQREILAARVSHDEYFAARTQIAQHEIHMVVDTFERLSRR